MKKYYIGITFLWILLISFQALAQIKNEQKLVVEDNANACEINSLYADQIAIEANNMDEKVFIIFRAGDGESSAANLRRYKIIRSFLKKNKGWQDTNTFIFSRGEKVDGKGRVEFYIGSKLFWTALAKKGKIPCMDCCGFDFENGKI